MLTVFVVTDGSLVVSTCGGNACASGCVENPQLKHQLGLDSLDGQLSGNGQVGLSLFFFFFFFFAHPLVSVFERSKRWSFDAWHCGSCSRSVLALRIASH